MPDTGSLNEAAALRQRLATLSGLAFLQGLADGSLPQPPFAAIFDAAGSLVAHGSGPRAMLTAPEDRVPQKSDGAAAAA